MKLSRVECGGRAAIVTARAVALVEAVYVVKEWRGGRLIETVEEIESFGDDIKAHALGQTYGARHAHVERGIAFRDAAIASQAAA